MAKHYEKIPKSFEKALNEQHAGAYLLRLYISGSTPKSARAIQNIRRICNEHLAGRYELEVIDTYQKPHMAKEQNIVALPTLIKELPVPIKRIIGDLSNTEKVLVGLDLIEKKPDSHEDSNKQNNE